MPCILNIDPAPGSVRLVNAMGEVTVTGNSTGSSTPLRALFGAVLHGLVTSNFPPHPWSPNVPAFQEGVVKLLDGTWSVSCPGARGNCNEDTIIVWGFFTNLATVILASDPFLGDSTGSGCGSGSGAPEAYHLASQVAPSPATRTTTPTSFPFEAMPRYYRLRLDLSAVAEQPLGSLVAGGLLRPTEIILEYDNKNPAFDQPIWRGVEPTDDSISWILQVRPSSGASSAHAVLQRVTRTRVLRPLVWQTARWNLFGTTLLTLDTTAHPGLTLPPLHVEPR